jgi:hypothetical protein
VETITVNKNELIATLRDNRQNHREIFEKALVVFREKVIEAFERRLDDAKNGRKIDTYIALPQPEDHTKDFDTAISMLEWETGERVKLSRRDFLRYVKNQWEWEASFAANTVSYSAQLDAAEQ